MLTDFDKAMLHLQAAFRAELDTLQTEAYRRGLADVPGDILRAAVAVAIKAEAIFPSVARLRTHCDTVRPAPPDPDTLRLPGANLKRLVGITTDASQDAEVKTFTLPGIGSMTLRIVPDDDPSLKRVYCAACQDSGWVESLRRPEHPAVEMPVQTRSGERRMPIEDQQLIYASRCACVEGNPVLVAQRQRAVRYSREAARGQR